MRPENVITVKKLDLVPGVTPSEPKTPLSLKDMEFIRQNHEKYTIGALAAVLGRSYEQVRSYLYRAGFRKGVGVAKTELAAEIEARSSDTAFAQAIGTARFSDWPIKRKQSPEYLAVMNARRLSGKREETRSFIGSSAAWAAEA